MNTIMIEQRGYESALSACPAQVAAFPAAAPAPVRPRTATPEYILALGAVSQFRGSALRFAGQAETQVDALVKTQSGNDVPTMLVQPHPGDTARRPPS